MSATTPVAVPPLDTHHLVTISFTEAAKLLGIGRTKAYELSRDGGFPVPVRNIAGSLRVRLVDLEAYLDDPASLV